MKVFFLEELAVLSILEYGKVREVAARSLGLSISLLDRAVREQQSKNKAEAKRSMKENTEKISPQMQYALALNEDGNFAGKGGVIFKWVGTHWEAQKGKELEADAVRFCFQVAPERTSERLAESAVATAALYVDRLPDPDKLSGMPLVPTRSGYLEVRPDKVVVRTAKKEDGLTYVLNCGFDEGADCSRWVNFLDEALPNPEIRNYLQEYVGYTLLADTRHEVAAWLIGEGGTGKGTTGVVVQALHRKVVAIDLENANQYTMASILDASLIYIDETPKSRIPEQAIKSAISGDMMSSDVKNRDPISFCPTGKWWLQGNHLPPLSDHTSGFWRRFIIFPFNIKPKDKIPLLAESIVEHELEGVLNWALAGLQRLLARGGFDTLPREMQILKDEAMLGSNSVASWADEMEVTIDAEGTASKEQTYGCYRDWCVRNGMKAVSSDTFTKRLFSVFPELQTSKPRISGRQTPSYNLKFLPPLETTAY